MLFSLVLSCFVPARTFSSNPVRLEISLSSFYIPCTVPSCKWLYREIMDRDSIYFDAKSLGTECNPR